MADKKQENSGPLGLGNPDDLSLNEYDRDVFIPRLIGRLATKHCQEEEDRRNRCMAKYGIAGLMICRDKLKELSKCINKWSLDPDLVQQCTEEYVRRRQLWRLKGDDAKFDEAETARRLEEMVKKSKS